MKRGAERQLTKDFRGDDDEDVDEEEPGVGIQKADESVLATRPMRALPKRSAFAATSSPSIMAGTPGRSEPELSTTPKFAGFSGFSGFGAPPESATTPFTFSATKPSVPSPSPASAFSTAPSLTFPGTTSNAQSTVSPSTSKALKAFASVVDSSKSANQMPNGNHADAEDGRLKAETTYYMALRGLNVAFISAAKKAIDSDPYADIAEVMEYYKTLRGAVKTDYEDSLKKTATTAAEIPSPAAKPSNAPSPISFGRPQSEPDTKKDVPPMPKAPASFTFGGFTPQAISSPPASSNATNGASSKSFSFGLKAASIPDVGISSSGAKSSFSFPASGAGPFTFGDSAKPTTSVFGGPSPSVFSSNLFGGSSEDKGKDTKEAKESKDNGTPVADSIFGGTSFGQPADKASTSSSGFSFGGTSASRPSPFGFGKSSGGSIGNPVGFGFGSPPKTPEAGTSTLSSSPPKFGGFTFGAPPKAETGGADSEGTDSPASEQVAPASDDAPPLLATGSVHDLEGEGEEDEETVRETKCKVYKLAKNDNGNPEWKDMGVGLFKLKAHKENGTRRFLLRNSGTGKIIINFNAHGGMAPSISKTVVSFMGHEDGASVPLKLRVKTPEQAAELKRLLDDEVEKVKAKS